MEVANDYGGAPGVHEHHLLMPLSTMWRHHVQNEDLNGWKCSYDY